MDTEQVNKQMWHAMLHGDIAPLQRNRHLHMLLPSNPRCSICNAPFGGVGGSIMRTVFQKRPSNLNPRFCNTCEQFAEHFPGGAEAEITMLFADVRGSTTLAEQISPSEFHALLHRFYSAAMNVLIERNAWIDKLVGDEVIALFLPGFAGADHARVGIDAAQAMRKAVGYGTSKGPFLPIGIGVHTDTVYVGVVGSEGVSDITALGDGMNTTARLVSSAAAGEIVVSDAAFNAAKLDPAGTETRELTLKGKSEPFKVRVLHPTAVESQQPEPA